MKLIYIAGPYRGDTEANILAATRMGQILKRGQKVFPIVPHVNGDGPDGYMLAGTMALMRRCDAVLALPTWQSSQGAVAEIRDADARGLPVFYSVDELYRWVAGQKVGTYNGQRGPLDVLLAGLPQTMLLRHAGRSQEVRHWRKEADDGLLYEAHTIEKVRLVSDAGAVFEEGGGTVGGVVPKVSSGKEFADMHQGLRQSTNATGGSPAPVATNIATHLPATRAEYLAWFKAKNINGQICPFCPSGILLLDETKWSCASCKRAGTYPELAQQGM